jgi:hypothetical protein
MSSSPKYDGDVRDDRNVQPESAVYEAEPSTTPITTSFGLVVDIERLATEATPLFV